MRHAATGGGIVSGLGDIKFILDKKYRDPAVPVIEGDRPACNLYETLGHCVHFIQVKWALGKPLYKMRVVAIGPNYFVAVLNRKRIKFYTHRVAQMQALRDFYGSRLVGWLHEFSVFECQGHFFSVTSDPTEVEECRVEKLKTRKPKRQPREIWAHQQPAVVAAIENGEKRK